MFRLRIAIVAAALLSGSASVAVAATPPPLLAPRAAVASDHLAASAAGVAVLKAGATLSMLPAPPRSRWASCTPNRRASAAAALRDHSHREAEQDLRARLSRTRPGRHHAGQLPQGRQGGSRAVQARRPGRRRPGRGAGTGRDGQALGRAAVQPLCRSGAEARGARLSGLVAAGAGFRGAGRQAQGERGRREVHGGVRRQEAGRRRHLAQARSGPHARQAARRAGRVLQGRDRGRRSSRPCAPRAAS